MNILEVWFEKAINDLRPGEELFFPVENKFEGSVIRKSLGKIKRIYEMVDPIVASRIEISLRYRHKQFWIAFKMKAIDPLIGYKKGTDGITRRVELSDNVDRARRIKLMFVDGYSLKQIEEVEGPLSEDEVDEYNLKKSIDN